MGIFTHREQILRHHAHWDHKPALRKAYHDFYRLIASQLSNLPHSKVVELGSGIGSIKDVIPQCLTTDMFPTPWSDQVENAYQLSFQDEAVSDLILVDVFHHLQYPGTALDEFHRVLRPGGKVIMLEPCIGALGSLVFGLFHQEGLKFNHVIEWNAPAGQSLESPDYYTSQGNATKIFLGKSYREQLKIWNHIEVIRLSALAYLASGGYTKPQLLFNQAFPLIKATERWFDVLPALFATRMIVVLTK
jgi:SAM-dependent methyltransferase